jgi:hypothetical protein
MEPRNDHKPTHRQRGRLNLQSCFDVSQLAATAHAPQNDGEMSLSVALPIATLALSFVVY